VGNIVEVYSLLEYDAVSTDEDIGEAYTSTLLECRKIPISEEGSKSTHNTPKYIHYHHKSVPA